MTTSIDWVHEIDASLVPNAVEHHQGLTTTQQRGIKTIQTSASGIFPATCCGRSVASTPSAAAPSKAVAVQPYQYITGPSSWRGGA